MIDESQSIYYLFYAVLCGATGIAYLKFQSTEGTIVTTKEFKNFQSTFLTGYSLVILCDFIAAASFYHTLVYLKFSLLQITKLFLTTSISSSITAVGMEIIDIGTKKDKCVVSAALYSISMFIFFFASHKHFDMLMIARVIYGAAAAFHHSSFESYAVQGHASLGFPDDWLGQTFSLLTHSMALMAAASGFTGQITSSMGGEMGCVVICYLLFALSAVYIIFMWEKDSSVPRFMLSGFTQNMSKCVSTLATNKSVLQLLIISSLCEASITIFSFYWAPWMSFMADDEDHKLPYEILFSCFILASMLGHYMFQLYIKSNTSSFGSAFHGILIGSSVTYFLGSIFQTPKMAFIISLAIHFFTGTYYPCMGHFRGRLISPEIRSAMIILGRIFSTIACLVVLSFTHNSPLLILASCAIMNGIAAYNMSLGFDKINMANRDDDDNGYEYDEESD